MHRTIPTYLLRSILLLIANTYIPTSYEEVIFPFLGALAPGLVGIRACTQRSECFFWQLYGYAVAQGCGVLSMANDE